MTESTSLHTLAAVAFSIAAIPALGQTVGQPLPPWTPGTLEIHQLDTGRGNAALWNLPDGATILLDAGAVPNRPGLELGPRRPSAGVTTAESIAAYITEFGARKPPAVDYAIATHFHDDHIAAFPDLAAKIPIRTLIDRGVDPAPPTFPGVRPYLTWRSTRQVDSARIGSAGQIASRTPGLEIRMVAGNGLVWTGSGDAAESRFPKDWQNLPQASRPTENHFSLAFRIRYGNFDYFTGGDLPGVVLDGAPQWHDLETPVAKAVGPVDVAVLNHHGWLDSTNDAFLDALQPVAVIIPAWHASHPDHWVMRRLRSPQRKPEKADLFITSLLPAPRAVFGYLGEPFRSNSGHIVLRVEPGGASYRIIVLDSEKSPPIVKAVFGPYASR